MITEKTINSLTRSINEKDVENTYRQYFSNKLPDMVFTSPFNCDGFGVSETKKLRVLFEFKDDLDLKSKPGQVKVLSQVVFYLKKFELAGQILPTMIFVGDRNECFTLHTNDLFKYLSRDLDWSTAPSNGHKNINLVAEMIGDESINPLVFDIKDLNQCFDKLTNLNDGVKRLIPITPHNLTEVFSYFEKNVLGKHNLTTNQLSNLFIQLLINPNDNFLHPIKKKTLMTKSFGEVPVKSNEAFTSFFGHFSNEYTPKQKENLTAIVDRLIQDVTRRKQGEFFTPTIWVDKAHEYIASVFGDDWKEKYVVWDPAWGTGNLTRDYKFKELYVSTLNYSDIQTAEQMGYNPEAVKFQFDFLNDDYDFLPKGLRDAIEGGKEIIVLMNPPYATANNLDNKQKSNSNKEGVSFSKIGKKMTELGFGTSSRQLYAQFMFRLDTMNSKNNINFAQFTQPTYKTGETYIKFREQILNKYECHKSFIFNGKHFADTNGVWSIDFSIFSKTNNTIREMTSDVLEYNSIDGFNTVYEKKIKTEHSNQKLSKWVRIEIKKFDKTKMVCLPHLTSALKVSNKSNQREINEGYLGSFVGLSNNISNNSTGVGLFTSTPTQGNSSISLSVIKDNFFKMVTTFSARKLVIPTWINFKDEYYEPNIVHPNYKQFTYDSLVYSLFNSHSQQSSLRQITYKDKLWDIKNEFFWMSKEEMLELANNTNYTELYNDARTDTNRYVYKLLFGEQNIYDQLSPDAKLVLDKATELTRMSMVMRQHFADNHNHLNSWDAGYAQLKLVWKEYFPDEFKEFRQLYKNLEDRMRPLVYELGFLLK